MSRVFCNLNIESKFTISRRENMNMLTKLGFTVNYIYTGNIKTWA